VANIIAPEQVYTEEKAMGRTRRLSGVILTALVLVSIAALALIPVACTSGRDTINLPSHDSADKGNPKLDSRLNQLVRAEMRGEAASFAEQSNIELVDGAVRVIIECVPGQLEAAAGAAAGAGARVETSYDDWLQVVAPITSLGALADTESIHFIRLPQQPLPAPNNQGKGLFNGAGGQI